MIKPDMPISSTEMEHANNDRSSAWDNLKNVEFADGRQERANSEPDTITGTYGIEHTDFTQIDTSTGAGCYEYLREMLDYEREQLDRRQEYLTSKDYDTIYTEEPALEGNLNPSQLSEETTQQLHKNQIQQNILSSLSGIDDSTTPADIIQKLDAKRETYHKIWTSEDATPAARTQAETNLNAVRDMRFMLENQLKQSKTDPESDNSKSAISKAAEQDAAKIINLASQQAELTKEINKREKALEVNKAQAAQDAFIERHKKTDIQRMEITLSQLQDDLGALELIAADDMELSAEEAKKRAEQSISRMRMQFLSWRARREANPKGSEEFLNARKQAHHFYSQMEAIQRVMRRIYGIEVDIDGKN